MNQKLGATEAQAPGARILFVSPQAKAGGPTKSLGLLLERFTALHRVGVLLPTSGHFEVWLRDRGVRYWTVPWLDRDELGAVFALFRFLRRERFDVVYANETNRLTRAVGVAAVLARIPFISHARSMGWNQSWKSLGHLAAASRVVAVSHACAESIRRYVRPGHLRVVHNGVPTAALPADREAARASVKRELGLNPSDRLILSVGNISPRKGQEYQLEAMARLVDKLPDTHLWIAGSGKARHAHYLRNVESRAAAPDLQERVTLLGFRSDIPRLLLAADLLLHTPHADPHPRAVLEAMAAGLPVVSFATDGVTETVVHGRTGYLVPSEDSRGLAIALLSLLENPEDARRMGAAGRDRVEESFSEDQTAEGVVRVVDEVLHGIGRRPGSDLDQARNLQSKASSSAAGNRFRHGLGQQA